MKRQRPTYTEPKVPALPRRPAASPGKALIRLNTPALRKKALLAHRKAEKALAQLRDQLKRYHEQDIPGFRSWVHRTFGHLLTRQRELQYAFEEKRTLVYEIQSIADRYRLSELAAYRKVLWRRAHPDEAQAEDRQYEEAENAREQARSRGQQPDEQDLDDLFDDALFDDARFKDEWLKDKPADAHESGHPDQKSVKDLYRSIVRQLHPDHHGQMTDSRKALWHEAQDAYRRHDQNALYSILARCDAGEAGLGDHTPVSLIRRMTQQLKTAAHATKNEMRSRRRDVAWDYETRIKNPHYVQDVKEDLQGMVRDLQWSLDEIQHELARLDRMLARQDLKRPLRGGPLRGI